MPLVRVTITYNTGGAPDQLAGADALVKNALEGVLPQGTSISVAGPYRRAGNDSPDEIWVNASFRNGEAATVPNDSNVFLAGIAGKISAALTGKRGKNGQDLTLVVALRWNDRIIGSASAPIR